MAVMVQGGGASGGAFASIFVTGLQSSDKVTATGNGKIYNGVWAQREASNQPLIPKMTSASTPSGQVTSTSYVSGFYDWYAFDRNNSTSCLQYGITPWTANWDLTYTFASSVVAQSISIDILKQTSASTNLTYDYIIQASTDGVTFNNLKAETITLYQGAGILSYNFETDTTIKAVRIHFNKVTRSSGSDAGFYITEFQVYGYASTSGFFIDKIKEYGTYTVTATNQEQTKTVTQNVLIDEADVVDVDMELPSNTTYLYYLGNEYTELTGGWSASNTFGFLTKYTTFLELNRTSGYLGVQTANTISMSGYKGHVMRFFDVTSYTYTSRASVDISGGDTYNVVGDNFKTGGITWGYPTAEYAEGYFDKQNTNGSMGVSAYAMFKEDDISGLSDYGATISAILSNSASLLASESGVTEMLTCTGEFMWQALQNSTWKTAYNSSSYKHLIDANPAWAKALALL